MADKKEYIDNIMEMTEKTQRIKFNDGRLLVCVFKRKTKIGGIVTNETDTVREITQALILQGTEEYKRGQWILISDFAVEYIDPTILFDANIDKRINRFQTYNVKTVGIITLDDIIGVVK